MTDLTWGMTTAAVVALTGALMCAAPAVADPLFVDSPCAGDELGHVGTAMDGTGVVCIADDAGQLTWMPEGGAAKTIADLQAQGYTVTIDQVGDNPLSTCIVTQVHNAATTTQRLGSGGTLGGGTGSLGDHHTSTVVVTKTIDVSLDCTGHG
ncbi:MAG: hypothetical protein ACR2JM_00615 [Mycobacterium sp.]